MQISQKHNFNISLTNKAILIEHYTVVADDQRMYMKEDNRDTKYFKGDR